MSFPQKLLQSQIAQKIGGLFSWPKQEREILSPLVSTPTPTATPTPTIAKLLQNQDKIEKQIFGAQTTATPTPKPTPVIQEPELEAYPIQPSPETGIKSFWPQAQEMEEATGIQGLGPRLLGIFGQESSYGTDPTAMKRTRGDVGPLQISQQYVPESDVQTAWNLKIPTERRRMLDPSLNFAVQLMENYYNQGLEMGLTPQKALDRATWKYHGRRNYLDLIKGRIEEARELLPSYF